MKDTLHSSGIKPIAGLKETDTTNGFPALPPAVPVDYWLREFQYHIIYHMQINQLPLYDIFHLKYKYFTAFTTYGYQLFIDIPLYIFRCSSKEIHLNSVDDEAQSFRTSGFRCEVHAQSDIKLFNDFLNIIIYNIKRMG